MRVPVRFAFVAAGLLASCAVAAQDAASVYPNKPIRINRRGKVIKATGVKIE